MEYVVDDPLLKSTSTLIVDNTGSTVLIAIAYLGTPDNEAIERLISNVYIPAIKAAKNGNGWSDDRELKELLDKIPEEYRTSITVIHGPTISPIIIATTAEHENMGVSPLIYSQYDKIYLITAKTQAQEIMEHAGQGMTTIEVGETQVSGPITIRVAAQTKKVHETENYALLEIGRE